MTRRPARRAGPSAPGAWPTGWARAAPNEPGGRLPREPLPLQQRAVQEAEEKMPLAGDAARWRASLESSVCALWTDPREERLASPPPWWRLLRTCPRVGPPSTGTPKARATATAHEVFFPTGTVIAAGKGRCLPLSVYWRNSLELESGGGFARGYSCMRKWPRREREPIGPNGWAQIPYL